MPDDWGGSRKLDVLARRVDLVRRLANSPAHKRDLIEDLDQSRSTIDRAVSELEDVSLVERGEEGFEATAAGRLALDRFEGFRRELEDIAEAEAVVDPLGTDAPIDTDAVTGGEALLAADPVPYRPLERFHGGLEDADRYRAALPALDDPRHVRLLYEHVVTHERPAEVVVPPALFRRIREEFPRRMAAMAETEGFRLFVGDVPPFALALFDADSGGADATSVYVVVFTENGGVHGVLVNRTPSAVRWAGNHYDAIRSGAEERTGALVADPDGGVEPMDADGGVTPVTVGESLSVGLEREGFVRLDVAYFRDEPVADPTTAWRAGLTVPEVHTGYAVERTIDDQAVGDDGVSPGVRGDADPAAAAAAAPIPTDPASGTEARSGEHSGGRAVTDAVTDALRAGTDCVVVGPPGSGKSTVCKRVACEWYDADRGPVLYRESGRGRPFESVEDLAVTLDAASGHALVVVEDAVRPEAAAVFEAVDRLGDREDVSFLFDARESEWRDPPDERAGVAGLETLTMPSLSDRDCERLVEHFERTIGESVDVPIERLREDVRDEAATDEGEAAPNEVLLLLHRLATYADPLAEGETSLEEAVAAVYDDFADDDPTLDVCVLANALNAAGIEVGVGALYAVADRAPADGSRDGYDVVEAATERLEGRVLFPRGDGTYRTVHEAWSVAFLEHLVEREGEKRAAERFGECVNALVALADDPDRRDELASRVIRDPLGTPTADPNEWADETVESVYALGRDYPKLAPLFGDGETDSVALPEASGERIAAERPVWLGRAFLDGGRYDRAERAFERLPTDDPDRAIDRHLGLARVAQNRGDYDDAVDHAERARTLAEDVDRSVGRARAGLCLGGVASNRGDFGDADSHYRAALETSEAVGDRRRTASTLNALGTNAFRQGEHDRARQCLERALEIETTLGDRQGAASNHNDLGIVARREGEFADARRHFERSLELSRALGDRRQAASTLNNLGIVAAMETDYDRARDCFERTLETKRTLGDRQGVTDTLNNLGLVAEKQGAYDRAREYLERALENHEELGNRSGEADACNNLGEVARLLGEYDRARDLHRRSLEINREVGQRQGEAQSLGNLGTVARLQGRYDPARERQRQRLAIARELDDSPGEATAHYDLGRVALRCVGYDRARERFEGALEVANDVGLERVAVECLDGLAEVAIGQGAHERAEKHLDAAEDRIDPDENPVVKARVERTRARLALERDRLDRARELAERTRERYEGMGAVHEAARSRRLLGRVAARAGSTATARDHFEAVVRVFEEVGAPQDALSTLEHVVDAGIEWDDAAAFDPCKRARELLPGTPDSAVEQHREWIDRECPGSDGSE